MKHIGAECFLKSHLTCWSRVVIDFHNIHYKSGLKFAATQINYFLGLKFKCVTFTENNCKLRSYHEGVQWVTPPSRKGRTR